MDPAWLVIPGVILWTGILVLPWQPWRNRETLEADANTSADLSDVTVLIPARNEADVIAETLLSLASQGHNLRIVLVDDKSTDTTEAEASRLKIAKPDDYQRQAPGTRLERQIMGLATGPGAGENRNHLVAGR